MELNSPSDLELASDEKALVVQLVPNIESTFSIGDCK